MSTIERLNELAKGATQDDRVSLQRYDHGGGRLAIFAPTRILIADFYIEADREYYAACNPAAIAQAATEYAAVVAERDALREALTGMVAQHGCDCGHPHCNRCAETRECKAALAQGEAGNG
jgi:hypothetical protein